MPPEKDLSSLVPSVHHSEFHTAGSECCRGLETRLIFVCHYLAARAHKNGS